MSPDFIVPDGFLFVRNGTIDVRPGGWGYASISYGELPTDGATALYLSCDESSFGIMGDCSLLPATAWAMNSSGRYYNFPPPVTITPAFTGSWFDPSQSGHGVFLEVLPNNQVLAGWFTFNPTGTEQAWFVGVGSYSGNTATVDSVVQPTGGRRIPNFDPSRIVATAWGRLTLTFTDCNHGRVDFDSTVPGYDRGSMSLTRLTQPAGLACP